MVAVEDSRSDPVAGSNGYAMLGQSPSATPITDPVSAFSQKITLLDEMMFDEWRRENFRPFQGPKEAELSKRQPEQSR